MRRKDVIDNIEGSRLKKQFLEAFLLQSAFMESLLKKLVEDDLFTNISFKIMQEEYKKGNFEEPKQLSFIREKLLRQNQFEMIEYIARIQIIDNDLKKQLHKYRENRNSVLHDLVSRMSEDAFEKELTDLVTLGQNILNHSKMVEASESIQRNEDTTEVLKSNDSERIRKFFNLPEEKTPTETGQ